MTTVQCVFYFFAFMAIAASVMVIVSKDPVKGALFLVLAFFNMAVIWLLLQAEFLALILVLVYVGAVMTLFLFVVMMLRVNVLRFREGFVKYLPFAILIMAAIMGTTIWAISHGQWGLMDPALGTPKPADWSNTAELGMALYTDYAYPFEIAAVLLLAAIIAAISLAHRTPQARKAQNSKDQMAVQRNERVRLVKMAAVEKIPLAGKEPPGL